MDLRILLVLSIVCLQNFSSGYKVLFLAPFNGKSHFLYVQSFVKALAERGHEVTFLTSNSLNNLKLANYTEVLIDPPLDLEARMPQSKLLEMESGSIWAHFNKINQMLFFPKLFNGYNLVDANVKKLIHSTGLHFDVIVSEEFFSESFLMFAHKFNAPVVSICPYGSTDFIDRQMGLFTPPSFIPHWMLTYTDKMTFPQRWFNAILGLYDWVIREYFYLPAEEEFAKKIFAHLEPLPSMKELLRRVSVVLVNTHRAIAAPRPSMPGVINIGGAHIKPAKPLPKDLQEFLDSAKNGVIYFSLGTVVRSSKLPREKVQIFLDAFRTVKQQVLWKFEDDSLTDIPPNVMIRKWMPQNDILAHPNVILFISHGGAFGTSEATHHGVPMFLIPFFGDQNRNAHRITAAGFGKYSLLADLTKDTFSATITELTSNDSYLTKAKSIAAIYKDNLVHPMDESIFWIEHVAKFKGAKHLQSHAVDMSLFSYFLLDVLLVNFLVIFLVCYALYFIAKKLFKKKEIKQKPGKKQD